MTTKIATETSSRNRFDELTQEISEGVAKMRSILDRNPKSLTGNDEAAFSRLEAKLEKCEREQEELMRRFPSLRTLVGDPAQRAIALGVGTHTSEPTLTEFAAENRTGGEFTVGDAEGFNLGKVIRGMATGQWSDADLERRALSEGVDASGGFLVPTLLSAQVVDRLRPKMAITTAGSPILPVEGASLRIPRIASGITGYWKQENAANTDSAPTFESIQLTPKTITAQVRLSRELFEDASGVALRAIENEILQSLATQIDATALTGSGTSPEPAGLLNISGVTQVTNGTNGAVPTWATIADSVKRLRTANVEPTATIASPRTWATLQNQVDTLGQPLRQPPYIDGVAQLDTTSVPTNITTGSSSNTSLAVTGDFKQLVIGSKLAQGFGVRLITDQSNSLDTLSVLVVAYARVAFGVLHPESFVIQTGLKA